MAFKNNEQELLDNNTIDHCIQKVFDKLPEQVHSIDPQTDGYNISIFIQAKQLIENNFSAVLIASLLLVLIGQFDYASTANLNPTDTLSLADYMELYVDESDDQTKDIEELEILAFLEPDLLDDDS